MKHALFLCIIAVTLAACGTTPAAPTSSQAAIVPTATSLPCQAAPAQPTPIAGIDSLFPAVNASDWSTGPADAPVTLVVYNDFQCVECNDKPLMDLLAAHPKDLRLVYRPYPQPKRYNKALLSAQAAEAAGLQGKFWEMHNLLFNQQADWVNLTPEAFTSWITAQAGTLGLDTARFASDLTSETVVAKVQKDVETGKAAGIPVLPLILINGQIYSAPKEYTAFDQVIRLTALGARQFNSCPAMEINPKKQYLATLHTKKGDIVIELFADKAPLTVNSFVFLARRGWFDGVTFHRVIPGFVAQAGDPSGTGLGGPGYVFQNEIVPSLRFDKPGMVGMANSGPDTNGSQFFITYGPQPSLDGLYTIFGHVLSGMDVLKNLTPRDPGSGGQIPEGDTILNVTIDEH